MLTAKFDKSYHSRNYENLEPLKETAEIMSLDFQKITASFMLLLVLALMPISFCRGECHSEVSRESCHKEEGMSKSVAVKYQRSESPSDNHSKPVRRVPGLPMPPEHASYSPVFAISSLQFFEPYKAVPEVFLPKFVPPHNLS